MLDMPHIDTVFHMYTQNKSRLPDYISTSNGHLLDEADMLISWGEVLQQSHAETHGSVLSRKDQ
jgi:hypothetical protein